MQTHAIPFCLAFVASGIFSHATTIGHWRMEGNDNDSSGNNLHLTDPNGKVGFGDNAVHTPGFPNPIPQTGAANTKHAFTLGGNVVAGPNPQELRLADDPLLPTGDFTVEAMVRWGLEVINNAVVGDIVSQWGSGQQAFRWGIATNNTMQMGISNVGATPFFTTLGSFTFVANNDYYVAAVVDLEPADATTVTFYVKDLTAGTPMQTIPGVTFATTLPSSLRDSTADLIIGGAASFNPESYGPRVDEVRLSSGVLAESELLITPVLGPIATYLSGFGLSGGDLDLNADVENGGAGDGITNAFEYLFQLDPTAVDSPSVYAPSLEIVGGKAVFTHYQDATAAAALTAVDATGSENLSGFSVLDAPTDYTKATNAGAGPGGLDEVIHTSVLDASDPSVLNFYRVEITE